MPVPSSVSAGLSARHSVPHYISTLVNIGRWQLLAAILVMTFTSLTEGLGVAYSSLSCK